jgi:hypothetical protein
MKLDRDIDQITASVRARLPDVEVDQWVKQDPTDDDGIWYFKRPGTTGEIQLESTSGNCPFTVESDGMKGSKQAKTQEAAVQLITDYLGSLKPAMAKS